MHTARLIELSQAFEYPVNLADFWINARIIGSEFLQAIVQVRQVNKVQVRLKPFLHAHRCTGNPVSAADVSHGTPEVKEWKLTQFSLQFIAQFSRVCPAIGHLATISSVLRARCDRNICTRVHVEPPERVCNDRCRSTRGECALAQRVPDHRSIDKVI